MVGEAVVRGVLETVGEAKMIHNEGREHMDDQSIKELMDVLNRIADAQERAADTDAEVLRQIIERDKQAAARDERQYKLWTEHYKGCEDLETVQVAILKLAKTAGLKVE